MVIVILDIGGGKYEDKILTRGAFPDCTIALIDDTSSLISYETLRSPNDVKTLIFKYGEFIEQNKSPKSHKIERIKYKTTGCFGTCPSFELNIDSNRNATFKSIKYNDKNKGLYRTIIKLNDFDEITEVLNYIDFPILNDEYSVNWTDAPTSTLTLTYDGGKVKTIKDYGLLGTFGLSRVYDLLFTLRENQNWK